MKRRFLVVLVFALVCVTLVGCGNNKKEFGKDSKAIYKLIDNYLDGYCKADAEAINALCVPKDVANNVNLINSDIYKDSEYPVVSFQKHVRMVNPAVFIATADYFRFHNWDNTRKYLSDYGTRKVEARYEINEVKHSDEVDVIYHMDGLTKVGADADEYVKTLTGLTVEDYYVISADIDWYIDGVKYGYDKKETEEIIKSIVDENEVSETLRNFERSYEVEDESLTTFIVYKYEGKWYVHSALIFRDSFSRRILLAPLEEAREYMEITEQFNFGGWAAVFEEN